MPIPHLPCKCSISYSPNKVNEHFQQIKNFILLHILSVDKAELKEALINSKMSIDEEIFLRSKSKSAGNTLCIAEHFWLAPGEN